MYTIKTTDHRGETSKTQGNDLKSAIKTAKSHRKIDWAETVEVVDENGETVWSRGKGIGLGFKIGLSAAIVVVILLAITLMKG